MMAAPRRSRYVAPYGSLLKCETPKKAKRLDMGRSPRVKDDAHLDAVRQCPCLKCGRDPTGVAAHVRMMAPGKPSPGMGAKPDDKDAVPLCHDCHMEQHRIGELKFWAALFRSPIKIAAALYRVSPNVEAMRAIVFAAQAICGAR